MAIKMDNRLQEPLQVKENGELRYEIHFLNTFSGLSDELQKLGYPADVKACIVADSNTAPLYADAVKEELEKAFGKAVVFLLPAGEPSKTLEHIEDLYEFLIQEHFERRDFLVALGGGVVGDMTGFAAATYLRGIDFIQVPTTLLAMVDSSIGGKTGVDFRGHKNMVGAFYMPKLVYMDLSTLKTLPQRELSCGMAEVIKYGYTFDAPFLSILKGSPDKVFSYDLPFLAQMIYRCCNYKRTVVEEDPREKGRRALLNFGHTIGHAVEKLKKFTLLHGECVSIGMAAAIYLSMKKGYLAESDLDGCRELASLYHLPTEVQADGFNAEDVLKTLKSDKKMSAGKVRFILLKKAGEGFIDHSLSDEELLDAIHSVLKE